MLHAEAELAEYVTKWGADQGLKTFLTGCPQGPTGSYRTGSVEAMPPEGWHAVALVESEPARVAG